jgi:hypothetical protein
MSMLDLDAFVPIDVHVHVHAEADGHVRCAFDDELRAAASKYFKGDHGYPTVAPIAAGYRALNLAAPVSTVGVLGLAPGGDRPSGGQQQREPGHA